MKRILSGIICAVTGVFFASVLSVGLWIYSIWRELPIIDNDTYVLKSGNNGQPGELSGSDQAVPHLLRMALVASEDKLFYQRPKKSTLACFVSLLVNYESGNSSIVSQLSKISLRFEHSNPITLSVKIVILSCILQNKLSKDTIISNYANNIYLGNEITGVVLGSEYYFGNAINNLTLAQFASLAALAKNPGIYISNRPVAMARRNQILDAMVGLDIVTSSEAEQAKLEPLTIRER